MKTYAKPDYVNNYDFYKCQKCGRLITHLEMTDGVPTGKVCPCGGLKYSPINPKRLQFLLPRVMLFAFYRAVGCA